MGYGSDGVYTFAILLDYVNSAYSMVPFGLESRIARWSEWQNFAWLYCTDPFHIPAQSDLDVWTTDVQGCASVVRTSVTLEPGT